MKPPCIKLGDCTHSVAEAATALADYHRARLSHRALTSPTQTIDFLIHHLEDKPYEVFGMITLTNRNHLIDVHDLFNGTLDGCSVYPREVVATVLAVNAAAVVLYHNHPSGVAIPSQADQMITSRLSDALGLIDARVLDHIIVAGHEHHSMAEAGTI